MQPPHKRERDSRRPASQSIEVKQYVVPYQMAGSEFSEADEWVSQVLTELKSIRAEGTDIKLQRVADGPSDANQQELIVARFAARSKGAIGRLNCRLNLPACGIRRVDPAE